MALLLLGAADGRATEAARGCAAWEGTAALAEEGGGGARK